MAHEQPTSLAPSLRPPIDHATQADIIDLALWAGQLLLQHGAESQRVEETVYRMGIALGSDWLDVFVSANALVITTRAQEFRTGIRRVTDRGVNMSVVSAINNLSRRVVVEDIDRAMLRQELQRISAQPYHYNRWLVVLMIGLACASFCRLFGGTWDVCGVTFCAASVALLVRQELANRAFNPLLTVTITAFVAGLIASSAVVLGLGTRPELALSAAVLLLVPGVPMINAAEDLLKGHPAVGLARAANAVLTALAIALGLVLAMLLAGVEGTL